MTLPDAPTTPQLQPTTPKSLGAFAVVALVVGIIAFLSGLLPIWGILAGGAAVALGVLALQQKQSKGLALTGLILGGLAIIASLSTTVALFSGISNPKDEPKPAAITSSTSNARATTSPSPTPTPTVSTSPTPSPTPTATTEAPPPPPPAPVETVSQTQAKRLAASYLDYSGFSRTGLIEQLEYEGFSAEDATYGVDSLGADWATQAAIVAKSYLDYSAFSHSGLVDQLIYEGFTPEEAEFGVTFVGL